MLSLYLRSHSGDTQLIQTKECGFWDVSLFSIMCTDLAVQTGFRVREDFSTLRGSVIARTWESEVPSREA